MSVINNQILSIFNPICVQHISGSARILCDLTGICFIYTAYIHGQFIAASGFRTAAARLYSRRDRSGSLANRCDGNTAAIGFRCRHIFSICGYSKRLILG